MRETGAEDACRSYARARTTSPAERVVPPLIPRGSVRAMRPLITAFIVATIAAAIASGCGGSSAPSPAASRAPAQTVSTVDAKQQAADAYVAWAERWNAVASADQRRITARCGAGKPWPPCAAAWGQVARHQRASVNALARVEMPAELARDRDRVVRSGARFAAAAAAMSNASTVIDQIDARRALTAASMASSSDVQVMRARLGLPPPKPIG